MAYELIKLSNKIYALWFDHRYDLGMHFVRYQEYYESSNPKFKGQKFTLIDFMEYYSKEFKRTANCFTYTKDWSGFNIPISVIKEVQALGIDDLNKYDKTMNEVMTEINCDGAYLLGSLTNDMGTMEHEIAHAIYYTNPEYKQEMLDLSNSLEEDNRQQVFDFLDMHGYHSDVYYDEMQAFLSTGSPILLDYAKGVKIGATFNKVFMKYAGELLSRTAELASLSKKMYLVEEQN